MELEYYGRALSREECHQKWSLIEARWGSFPGAWYPMIGSDLPPDVIVFQERWFYHALPLEKLRAILRNQGISQVWELREGGSGWEIDLALLELYYDGSEGYWTSQELDWLIYASHESSLTVAGAWLIEAVKSTWPDWEQYLYTTYDYPRPPSC